MRILTLPQTERSRRARACPDCSGDGLSPYGRWLHEYGALVTDADDRTARGAEVPAELLTELAAVRDARPEPTPGIADAAGAVLACATCRGSGQCPNRRNTR